MKKRILLKKITNYLKTEPIINDFLIKKYKIKRYEKHYGILDGEKNEYITTRATNSLNETKYFCFRIKDNMIIDVNECSKPTVFDFFDKIDTNTLECLIVVLTCILGLFAIGYAVVMKIIEMYG